MSGDFKNVEDLRETIKALSALLDELEALKESEAKLVEAKSRAESMVRDISEEYDAELYSQQRKADRMRDQIEEPKKELAKLKKISFGYDTIGGKISALESKIEANKQVEAKRAALLAQPVKLSPDNSKAADEYISTIRTKCAKHDAERARIHSEIVHLSGILANEAKVLSWNQNTNYPSMSIDSISEKLYRMETGIYLRG